MAKRKEKEIVGLLGVIGGGKDFTANQYIEMHGFHHFKHADGLREITEKCLKVDLSDPQVYEEFKKADIPKFNGYHFIHELFEYLKKNVENVSLVKVLRLTDKILDTKLEGDFPGFSIFLDSTHSVALNGRVFLQRLGNSARDIFGNTIWIDLVYKRSEDADKVIISDVRYMNEAQEVLKRGGKLLLCNYTANPRYNPSDPHVSEKLAQDILSAGINQHWVQVTQEDLDKLPS
jgi:hypothetical protein